MIGRIDIPLASILLLIALTGCSDYQGISPTAYQYAKALYNVTNRKRGEKLDEVNNLITSSKREGTITTQEANWLREIVDDAREGNWEAAQKTARQMMRDQVQKP
ncbi:MAG: hypothetical protein VX970_06900 [Planctomycetota bacterium]|nr:hypothetical protein [Planctomycetota bacterium]MEC8338719.1 hypothetical protein [Planctomycetota bacterium]